MKIAIGEHGNPQSDVGLRAALAHVELTELPPEYEEQFELELTDREFAQLSRSVTRKDASAPFRGTKIAFGVVSSLVYARHWAASGGKPSLRVCSAG